MKCKVCGKDMSHVKNTIHQRGYLDQVKYHCNACNIDGYETIKYSISSLNPKSTTTLEYYKGGKKL